jgi:hypothetical protein
MGYGCRPISGAFVLASCPFIACCAVLTGFLAITFKSNSISIYSRDRVIRSRRTFWCGRDHMIVVHGNVDRVCKIV